MNRWKRGIALALTAAFCGAAPLPCLAATPEFARSAEEWAGLADDYLEYGEIPDLIHEYNATVRKNQIDLNEFRKDYGVSNDEWADRYRELADDLESSLDYPDVDDIGYAAAMSAIVTSEMQIDNWRELADEASEDYLTYYYTYCSAEAMLASGAQSDMIQYYLYQLQLDADEKRSALQEETYQSILKKRELGIATEADVLSAQEALKSAQKAVRDDNALIQNTREKLLVMLGWSHDANPRFGSIPELDKEAISKMNPETDKETAIENSYTMKVNLRKLENAKSQDIKESLEETLREDRQSIGASVTSAWQNVLTCQSALELNESKAEVERKNFQTVERQYQLGSVSGLDYLTQKYNAETADIQTEVSRLNLFQAVQSYEWILNGLAGTS